EDGIRDLTVTGVQTCALPICTSVSDRGTSRQYPTLGRWPIHPPYSSSVLRTSPIVTSTVWRETTTPPQASAMRRSWPTYSPSWEIGRASCRERVQDAGGAGSV